MVIIIYTDGYCHDLIPIYMEADITGIYPIEATCGMDVVRVSQEFPNLEMMGGVSSNLTRLRGALDMAIPQRKNVTAC